MGRPKEFDEDQALADAIGVFWREGYEATSIQHLTEAMGIQRASLYATFGDKHSLYVRALRHYQQQGLRDLTGELENTDDPRGAILSLLQRSAENSAGRGGRRGCFCVNANIELAPQDQKISKALREHSEAVEALLASAIRRARQLGQPAGRGDPDQLAVMLYGLIIAMNVLGKQRASRERLQALVEQGAAALDA